MAITSRVRVLGLLAVGVAWGCGGTATRGDSDSSETDATGSSDGFGGDFADGAGGSVGGSGGSGGSASDSDTDSDTSGDSTASAGGGPTTRGNNSGTTTRGTTTRGDTTTASGDTTSAGDTTSGDTTSAGGTTSGDTTGGDTSNAATSSISGSAVSTGAGGMVGAADSVSSATTVSTSGNGGFGGDPTSGTATFTTSSVVTSTTGADPDPELDDFPYLDGCSDSYWTVGTDYCSLGFSCSDPSGSAESGYSSCWNYGGGEFSCSCNRDYFYSNYALSGSNSDDACAYAASACVAGTDAERGQPVCTPSYLYQGTTHCSANAACRTTVDVEGADMVRTSNNNINCEQRDDSWVCNCYTSDRQLTFTLSPEDGSSEMCVEALDWCGGEVTREGPRDCRPSSQNASTNSCYSTLLCTEEVVVGDAPATLSESFTLRCERDESDGWVCDCPGAGSFEVEAETAWDACTLGASECTPE